MARTLRLTLSCLVAGAALAAGLPATAALAATPPAPPTSATSTVGDRFADLSWSGGTGTGAIVRDVTGTPSPYTTGSGRDVPVSSPTTARDPGFTNRGTASYAVFTTESDGTPSDTPLMTDVAQVPLVATTVTLRSSVGKALWGTPITLSGVLTRADAAPVANAPVELYGKTVGATDLRLLRRVQTDGAGTATTSVALSRTTDFQWRFRGDAFSAASDSPHAVVQMLPRVSLATSPASILRGETSVLTGRVVPTLGGASVYLQALTGSSWRNVALVRTASDGTFQSGQHPGLGIYRYRAVLVARSAYLAATSNAAQLRVESRDLASGTQGSDVLELQRSLQALHYVPGTLNGSFGYDTQHAVMAFQKVERLAVTGRWSKAERARLARPAAWKVRYPGVARAAEVDITRQVLVLSEKGVVRMIVDVSTGTEKPYTYEGVSDVAHTPRGAFSIFSKIDGVRVSKLGELYRPSYFYKGWAIHGSGSVPNYPASHGCVRITNPNADRLFPLLVKGTPVTLYDE